MTNHNIHIHYKHIINKFKYLIHKKKYILEIHCVSENVIKKYNNKYRGINKPTDVLSFKLNNNFGIIILCINQIHKNTYYDNKITADNISYVLAHGLAHLAGFDHTDDITQKKMDKFIRHLLI